MDLPSGRKLIITSLIILDATIFFIIMVFGTIGNNNWCGILCLTRNSQPNSQKHGGHIFL